jgi:signal transduction histidine kinase
LSGRQNATVSAEDTAGAVVRVASLLLSRGTIEDGLRQIAWEALRLWRADEAAVLDGSRTLVLLRPARTSGPAAVGRGGDDEAGPAAVVPFPGLETGSGQLRLRRRPGLSPFTDEERRVLNGFAEHTATFVRQVAALRDAERRQVLAERERIARDLHDHVIGRLVGAGMTINGLSRWITDPAGRQRLSEGLDEMDAAVRDIRASVHALRRGDPGSTDAGERVRQVVAEAAGHLGFEPTLTVSDVLERIDRPQLLDNVIAVLRESLTNVARHADARQVEVTVDHGGSGGRTVLVRVDDDGRGTARWPATGEPGLDGGHGLANLAYRADALGGTFRVDGVPGRGSTVVWEVPVPDGDEAGTGDVASA